ncbi:MAG: hypothetical protein MR778_00085, partial [Clostridiales bacterium]|nr:hypothetical protein [Clostridiales bacterium]MDD6936507.1 hypothetical protein [Clostridiales bacterium]MDY2962420.1 hypothetical protein [Oscillospiraceae bacterium]
YPFLRSSFFAANRIRREMRRMTLSVNEMALVTFHDLTASLLSRKRASAASALQRAASALGENLFFARFSAPPM